MVSKSQMNIIIGILLLFLTLVFVIGFSDTHPINSTMAVSASVQQNVYQDTEWAKNVSETMTILISEVNNLGPALKNLDWYTALADLNIYKLDLDKAIASSDSFTVSPELQSCKNEYRLGLIDDDNAALLMKTAISLLTAGDFKSSSDTMDLVSDDFRSANSHYDNVTNLLSSYNKNHPYAQLDIPLIHHNVDPKVNKPTPVSTPIKSPERVTKTLADKESDTDYVTTDTPVSTTPTPQTIDLSGKGSKATDSFKLEAGLARFKTTYTGSDYFGVWLMDAKTGEKIYLVANEVGTSNESRYPLKIRW